MGSTPGEEDFFVIFVINFYVLALPGGVLCRADNPLSCLPIAYDIACEFSLKSSRRDVQHRVCVEA